MELPVEVGVDVMEAGVVVNGVESVIPTQYAYVGHRPLQSVCAAGFQPKNSLGVIECSVAMSTQESLSCAIYHLLQFEG